MHCLDQKLCCDSCAQKVYLMHNSPQNSSVSHCNNNSNFYLGHLKVDRFLFASICSVQCFMSRKLSTFCYPKFAYVVVYTILVSVGVAFSH